MSRLHRHLDRRRWAGVRRWVLDRAGWRCCSCGRAGRLEVDHIEPLKSGGDPWEESNLQALCRACHIAKTAAENSRPLTAAEQRWRELVAELADLSVAPPTDREGCLTIREPKL